MSRSPLSTYRFQFTPEFGFNQAREVVDYLEKLGISDIYASPVLKARKGTTHGYDMVDPTVLNPELGSEDDFNLLTSDVKSRGMGYIQDIVPNHMAFNYDNGILMDVLEKGENSKFFNFFDINWDHHYETMKGKLLAPFLGRFYGDALEDGEIKLEYGENGFSIAYSNNRFPIAIETYPTILTHRLPELREKIGRHNSDMIKLMGILYALHLDPKSDIEDWYEQTIFIKRVLWEIYSLSGDIKEFINTNLAIFNGEKGKPETFNLLDKLLASQHFRLSFWKVATEEIDYKRFFVIDDLISVRSENEPVFLYTHGKILEYVRQGKITGLRIDHIDGLYDPVKYLIRVRENFGDVYLIVEKILGYDEEFPTWWPVEGTTGYEFGAYANGVFSNKEARDRFDQIYSNFIGWKYRYDNLLVEKKKLIIEQHMTGDIDNLAYLLKTVSGRYRHGNDFTLYSLKRAIIEIMAHFPVYRTYINRDHIGKTDIDYVTEAVRKARRSSPKLMFEMEFIEKVLLLRFDDFLTDEDKEHWYHFVMRFQQFTGPLMAKGFEDTLLYVFNRLVSQNEVGGNPEKFGTSVEEFHAFNSRNQQYHPCTMNGTSTHDSKRGEDVRARLNVLSEIPDEWENKLREWREINQKYKRKVEGFEVPDSNDEYFLYQILLGAYPVKKDEYGDFVTRIKQYVIKSVREAKVYTAWLKPDIEYENAFIEFINDILEGDGAGNFQKAFNPFQEKVEYYGYFNSLSQVVLKTTSPGIPDFYQGTELWDLNLVDPDNRRPVDYTKRKRYLEEFSVPCSDIHSYLAELWEKRRDGNIKLFMIHCLLRQRNNNRDLFLQGEYIPLNVKGDFKNSIIAFMRRHGSNAAVIAVPRFLTGIVGLETLPIGEVWHDTALDIHESKIRSWQNVFTGETLNPEGEIKVSEIMRHFPAAFLTGKEES